MEQNNMEVDDEPAAHQHGRLSRKTNVVVDTLALYVGQEFRRFLEKYLII